VIRIGAIALAIIALMLGVGISLLLKWERDEVSRVAERRRQEAIAKIQTDAGEQIPVHDGIVVARIADDPVNSKLVKSVVLFMCDLSEPGFQRIKSLSNLRLLTIYSCTNADALLKALEGMPSVEKIFIEASPFTEKGGRSLATLPNLQLLFLEQIVPKTQRESLQKALPNVTIETADSAAEQ
jgi:hypothetical protein